MARNIYKISIIILSLVSIALLIAFSSCSLNGKVHEVYEISDLYEIDGDRSHRYKEVLLMNDLDFSDVEKFQPINLHDIDFNGNGYSFKNLTINVYDEFEGVLYDTENVFDLTIENLKFNCFENDASPSLFDPHIRLFNNVHLYGEVFAEYSNVFGGFVTSENCALATSFENCSSNLNIKGGKIVAGFVAGRVDKTYYATFSFRNCVSDCIIDADKHAAGFISINSPDASKSMYFYDSINKSTIKSKGTAGGFVNMAQFACFYNCVNEGDVVSNEYAGGTGGIIGELEGGFIKNCTNNAKIEGTYNVGGIVGIQNCPVADSVNNGEVVSTKPLEDTYANLGGITGRLSSGSIVNCTNNADLTNNYGVVGGIVGECKGNLIGCVNNAKITGSVSVGGIVGMALKKVIINQCTNAGEIHGSSMVGGIIGGAGREDKSSGIFSNLFDSIFPKDELVIDILYCKSTGDIHANTYAGGIVGLLYSSQANSDLIHTNTFEGTIHCNGSSNEMCNKYQK